MSQTIKLKRSATQNKIPAVGDIELGEIAINTYDGKMFIKKNDGADSIVRLGNVKSDEVEYIKKLTQADYDLLTPQSDTLYIITDADNPKVEELADVNLTTLQDGQVLTWDNTNSEWVNSTISSGTSDFVSLSDTPANYTGAGGQFLKVNAGATAVEFGTTGIDELSDVDTSTTAPTNGQTLKWDGTNWTPADDTGTAYTAGTGLDLTGTTFSLDADLNELNDVNITSVQDKDYVMWDNATSRWINQAPQTQSINVMNDVDTTTTAPTNGQTLKWDGLNWTPADDTDTTYTAGTGLDLTGTTFSLDSGIDLLSDVDTSTTAPTNGQTLKWDGTNWTPADDTGTAYTAGTGLDLTGTTFSLDAELNELNDVNITSVQDKDYVMWDNATSRWINQAPQTMSINDLNDVDTSTTSPVLDDYIAWDGANWSTKTPATVSLNDLDDVTTTGQSSGDIIQYNGTNWALATIPAQIMLQDTDFDATAGQTAFVVTNKVFSTAFVYTNGSKDRSNTYSITDNGTDTTITFNTGKNLNDWVSVEYEA